MEGRVGVQQTQGHAIGDGPAVGEVVLDGVDTQVWRVGRQARFAPIEAPPAIVEVGMAGDRTQAGRAQLLDPLLAARLLLGARGHDGFASRIQDSSNSSPKQRW